MEYTVKVDKKGTVRYYKPGTDVLHREDGPAEVYENGGEYWYKEGELHREDGPAIMFPDGRQYWCIDGKQLSREEFDGRTKEEKVCTFTVPVGAKEIRIQFE